MKGYLRAGLIALVSVPIGLADPTPAVSPSEPPLPSASAHTNSNLVPQRPRSNLTAVVDPIAVPVRDGVLVRVGARNSGPRTITASADQPAVTLSLITPLWSSIGPVKSLGSCQVRYLYPPNWPTFPEEPYRYDCSSTRTLRVGETHWQAFVFHSFSGLANGVSVAVSGYVQDSDDRDNKRDVVVRLAESGSGLPVTGASTISVAGAGVALVIAGIVAIWYGRRRRPGPTLDSKVQA